MFYTVVTVAFAACLIAGDLLLAWLLFTLIASIVRPDRAKADEATGKKL